VFLLRFVEDFFRFSPILVCSHDGHLLRSQNASHGHVVPYKIYIERQWPRRDSVERSEWTSRPQHHRGTGAPSGVG
jgi:hypothetical protein